MEKLKKIKRAYTLFSICLILLGAVFLLKPDIGAQTLCRLCGFLFLLFGIVKLFAYFSRDLWGLVFQFDLAMGIISSFLGFMMVFWTRQFMDVLMIALGLVLVFDALLRIQTALDAKKLGVDLWWMILLVALMTAIIGTLVFLRPYAGRKALMILLGLDLMIDGFLNFFVVQTTAKTISRYSRDN